MFSKISRRYSLALYNAAEKLKKVNDVAQESKMILQLLKSSNELTLFFTSPIIREDKKIKIVEELFKGKVTNITFDFMKLLILRKREPLISYIFEDFLELKNEKDGITSIKVRSAVKLDKAEETKLKKRIEEYSKLKCIPSFELDEDLVGGFTVQVKDTILDASIYRQLQLLRSKFKESSTNFNN